MGKKKSTEKKRKEIFFFPFSLKNYRKERNHGKPNKKKTYKDKTYKERKKNKKNLF